MNKDRRAQIAKALGMIEDALTILTEAKDDEEAYKDAMPENMQGTDRYSESEGYVSAMENAINEMENVVNSSSDMGVDR